LLRNFCGIVGIGLLSAALLGGAFGWTGPMAYLLVTEGALAHGMTTPWIWAAHSPLDLGAALCAAVTFTIGLLVVTIHGDRDRVIR
jgi:hypothetical protein